MATCGSPNTTPIASPVTRQLGKLTADIHIPSLQAGLADITNGADGNLYFTEIATTGKIGVLNPNTIVPDPGPCLTVTHDTTLSADIGPAGATGSWSQPATSP